MNIAIQTLAQGRVRGDLVAGRVPPEVMDELAAVVAGAPEPEFADVLPAERIMLSAVLDEMHLENGRPDPEAIEGLRRSAEMLAAASRLFDVELSVEVPAAEAVDLDSLPGLSEIEKSIDAAWPEIERLGSRPLGERWRGREAFEAIGQDWPLTADAAATTIAAMGLANGSVLQFSLSRDGLLTMLAIERFRRDFGRLPPTLDRLAPRYLPHVPRDPLGAGPLRYRIDQSELGYTLYSVGFDGEDDGGAVDERPHRALHPEGRGFDFVFTAHDGR